MVRRSKQFLQVLDALTLAVALLFPAFAHAGEVEWKVHMDAGYAAYVAGDHQTAIVRLEKALAEAQAFDVSDERYTRSIDHLAFLYESQARYADAEPLRRRSLEMREKTLGAKHTEVANSLNALAMLYLNQGRYGDAEPLFQLSLGIRENAAEPNYQSLAQSIENLAGLYKQQGRYAEAEPLFRRSLDIREKAHGSDHQDVALSLHNLAGLYAAQSRYGEAEFLYRRSLGIFEKVLGPDHEDVGLSLNDLALLLEAQGRYTNAEALSRRALQISEKAFGQTHPRVAVSLNNLAHLYLKQSRYADAESLFKRSLSIFETTLGPDHLNVSYALNNLAGVYQEQGHYTNAEALYQRSLQIRETALGTIHPSVAAAFNNLATLYFAQGLYENAEPLFRRTLEVGEKSLGPDHPNIAKTLSNLAKVYRKQGKIDGALALVRRMNRSLSLRFPPDKGASRLGALAEQGTYSVGFDFHISLLAETLEHKPQMRFEASQEAFGIAQLARASSTADQVAKMASRYAAGSDALAKLARERQDALARLEQFDARIVQVAGQRDKEALAANLRAESASATKAIANLDARLEREYPKFKELTNPAPLELVAAQKLLAEDEAMVLLLVSGDESFLWALRRNDVGFFKLALKRTELVEMVTRLRVQLDLGASEPERILAQPFDVAAAYELYRKVLAPAEALLVGAKQLIFIPDGAMQSLPPGLLVTETPAKSSVSLAELAQVPWLAKKYAITVLPAVGSLRALRQFTRIPTSQEPFTGFGDPLLQGSGADARKGNITALYSRGAVADANEVRQLARLPESAGELRAIAAALKAPTSSIRLGAAATERAVKEADLARYRNLAFATHGLMAGDFKGLAEPALVLTPPEKGSELDDGLLTAGEISQLKLDADWVVLSACNTAAPDGTPGAEGLSGLARAFFYAGARSLLVSHWAVSSDAAVAITTRMFAESAKGASKTEALRRSMLALMGRKDKPYFAHPAFWAPFVVVGEGNTDWTR